VRLAQTGLHKDEAEALVKVWHDGFIKHDGLSLLYRVPQSVYDRWLPLEAKPAPSKIVRVGLVLHQHLEPELDSRVEVLIAKLSSENFEVRQAAEKELMLIGGAAFPMLDKGAQSKEPEVASRCQRVLDALNARAAVDKVFAPAALKSECTKTKGQTQAEDF